MAFKLIIEGDDKDELIAALDAAKEMLGAEAEESGDDDDSSGDDDDSSGDDDDSSDDDDNEEILGKIRKQIAKLVKTDEGPGKVKAALAKFKAKKLDQVDGAKLPALAKMLGVKA
jgi:hypothetical protein